MKLRRRILIPGLLLLLIGGAGGGMLYLRSDSFQEFARQALVSRLERATGLSCKIDNLRLDVFHGKFVISGLRLSPGNASKGTVNLQVPQIRASLSISSFWHLRVRLGELRVTRPRVELNSGDGGSTWNPEDTLKGLKISTRLEASKVTIDQGWLKINDRTAPFQLSLDDLDCEVRYVKEHPIYRVRIEYTRSRIFWERRDILHGLEFKADVSLQGIEIESFAFRRPGMGIPSMPKTDTLLTGSGSIKDWKSPVLLLHITGVLDARDLVLASPSLHEGRGDIQIAADLRNDQHGISAKGTFRSPAGAYRKMGFRSLAGAFDIKNDVLHLRNISGNAATGTLVVNAEIQLREANKDPNRVVVAARNVPVVEAGRLLELPLLNLENAADSRTTLTWFGGRELRADCSARLHGMARSAVTTGPSTLLDGSVQFTYFDTGSLLIEKASLNSPFTTVLAFGGQGSVFHVQLSTSRISEPADLIANFSPPVADLLRREPDLREMAGLFFYNGDVRIESSSDVECNGSVSIRNGRWRSFKVDTLATHALFHPPHLELRSLSAQSGPQQLRGDLALELADGERISKLGFKGNVRQISLSSLKNYGLNTPGVTGSLSGSGSVRLERNSWEGDGQFTVENGSYDGTRFDGLVAHLGLGDRKLRIRQAEAWRDATRVSAAGSVDFVSRELNLETRLQGFPLQEVPIVRQKSLQARGRIGLSGTLEGTLENPAFSGNLEMDALQYESWRIGSGNGRVEYGNGSIRGDVRIKSGFGNLRVRADIATSKGYPGRATVEFDDLDIQNIITAKPPSYLENLTTAMEGSLEAEGNFENPDSLRIRGDVDGAHFRIHDYEVRNAGRMRFVIANRSFRMESVRFVGEGTSLSLSGTIPLDDSPLLDLSLSGSLNLELLEGVENKLHTSGAATLNIRASGSKKEPQVIGQASFSDTRLDYKDFPFRFSAMQGDIVFSRNLVRFENVRGSTASGTVQLSGIIEHRNAVFRSVNMAISMRNVRVPFPKDFRTVANADLVLNGSTDAQILSGEVDVVRMEYVRSFNLLEQLASHGSVQSGPLTTDPYLMGLRLNVEIRSDSGLSIDNELTRLRAGMRLTLRGTPAYPSLTGHVEASEGTIFFRGSRFEISHATADFVDRNRINPVLEIRAEADVKTYRLILDAIGDMEHLNINVSSDPPMSTVDIISLLTTGKTETGTGTSQRESQMAGMSAASVLSENLTGVIGKRVQRIFGLESFRVDPFLAGAENDPTARITVSERLSKEMVVTFSRNLSTNQEQIVVIEYDVGRNVSVVATRDEDGKFGLDFRLRKRLR